MRWIKTMPLRLRSLFLRARLDRELDDELCDHLDRKTALYVAGGMEPAEARRQALLDLGGIEQAKENCRDQRRVAWLQDLLADLRYGARILAKNWKPASVAACSLGAAMALGIIGLGIFNGTLLRPPVATQPGRLVSIYTATPGSLTDGVSYPDYQYYREHNHSFSDVAAFLNEISLHPMSQGRWEGPGMVETVSDNYFAVMGLRPFLGRFFAPGDTKAPVVVLTYSCWKRWGANPGIVGETLTLKPGTYTYTIVGVAPADFTGPVFGFAADVIFPLYPGADRTAHHLFLYGRLKPQIGIERARADLRTLSGQLATSYPKADRDRVAMLAPATAFPPDGRSTAQLICVVLVTAVLLVLLLACANVASLLLGLATGRKREMLIREAVGATRGRLIRQLLAESAILCVAGGAAGFLLASAALDFLSQFQARMSVVGTLRFAANLRTDGAVLAMTVALVLLATLATGLAPAFHATATNLAGALSGEVVVGGRRKNAARSVLLVIQIAICTVALVGVGLCLRSLRNLVDVSLGFSARNLAAVLVDVGANGQSQAQGLALYGPLRRAASRLGGIRESTLAAELPLTASLWPAEKVWIEGPSGAPAAPIPTNTVDDGYFATLGIPLLSGRTFNSDDTKDSPEVVVIDNDMARTYWPGASPIGKQLRLGNGNQIATVIGVVGDSKCNALDEPTHPAMYDALSQHYQSQLMLAVRTRGNPQSWLQPLAGMVRRLGVSSDMPPFTWSDVMSFALLVPRLTLWIVSALGAVALLLAVLGLYGTTFYSVSERRREIAIRAALGAQPSHLLGLVLRQTAILAGLGVLVGLLLGIALTILFRSQFFGISPIELSVLIPVAAAMALVSAAIAYWAARPRINTDPLEAVRHA